MHNGRGQEDLIPARCASKRTEARQFLYTNANRIRYHVRYMEIQERFGQIMQYIYLSINN